MALTEARWTLTLAAGQFNVEKKPIPKLVLKPPVTSSLPVMHVSAHPLLRPPLLSLSPPRFCVCVR